MAIHIETELEIERPAGEVFEYLANGENLARWMDEFSEVEKVSDGPVGKGTTYRYVMKRGAASTFEWSEFEPGRKVAWEGPAVGAGVGSLEPRGSFEIEPINGGTRVRGTLRPQTHGFLKLLSPLMARSIRMGSTRDFLRLKLILERGSAER
jgi:uncharacterized protein YndB with AHSA1/START domain